MNMQFIEIWMEIDIQIHLYLFVCFIFNSGLPNTLNIPDYNTVAVFYTQHTQIRTYIGFECYKYIYKARYVYMTRYGKR